MKKIILDLFDFFDQYPYVLALILVAIILIILFCVLFVGKHKIKFIDESDSGIKYHSIHARKGELIILPQPEREGYKFVGWYFDKKFTHFALVSTMPSNSFKLYACWLKITEEQIAKTEVVLIPEDISMNIRKPQNFCTALKEGSIRNQELFVKLANELLKYRGVTYRYTKKAATFKYKGVPLLMIYLSNDNMKAYFNLEPSYYEQATYHHKDVSNTKSKQQTPLMLPLKTNKAIERASFFITELAKTYELKEKQRYTEYSYDKLVLALKRAPIIECGFENLVREKINALDTNILSDRNAEDMIKYKEAPHGEITNTVYVSELNDYFPDGGVVNLAQLKKKKLVPVEATGYKLLGKGTLSKALTVVVDDISLAAAKMIFITGGKVIKLK